jgi:hypothetical protein
VRQSLEHLVVNRARCQVTVVGEHGLLEFELVVAEDPEVVGLGDGIARGHDVTCQTLALVADPERPGVVLGAQHLCPGERVPAELGDDHEVEHPSP